MSFLFYVFLLSLQCLFTLPLLSLWTFLFSVSALPLLYIYRIDRVPCPFLSCTLDRSFFEIALLFLGLVFAFESLTKKQLNRKGLFHIEGNSFF